MFRTELTNSGKRKHIFLFGIKIASVKVKQKARKKIKQYSETVVYTYQSCGYDRLLSHNHFVGDWDYVCFTEDKNLLKHEFIGPWEIREAKFNKLDSKRNSGWHKTHPHVLLPEYKNSIWIDGNVNVVTDYLEKLVKGTSKHILTPVHNDRDCIYAEIDAVKNIKYDTEEMCEKTRQMLLQNNMPEHYGLCETNILFRQHNDSLIRSIDDMWWQCIQSYSKRDQLSFTYCLYKHNIDVKDVIIPNIRKNENCEVRSHNHHHG
jgi:hypothetical protein